MLLIILSSIKIKQNFGLFPSHLWLGSVKAWAKWMRRPQDKAVTHDVFDARRPMPNVVSIVSDIGQRCSVNVDATLDVTRDA